VSLLVNKLKGKMRLESIFVCPICKSELFFETNQHYICEACDSNYPTLNGVPIFLTGRRDTDVMNKFWDEGWKNRFKNTDHAFWEEESNEIFKDRIEKNVDKMLERGRHAITETIPINEKIVLNIGCGTGEAPAFMALGAKNYIGIDYSYNAAKYSIEAIKKMDGSGITAQANAELLPIGDDSIDIAYSHGVLHHTPETQIALDEIYRVLKPAGLGVIALYSTWSPTFLVARAIGTMKSIFTDKYNEWYEEGEQAWKTGGELNPWTKTYSLRELKNLFSIYDISELKFRKNGFSWGNAIPKLGKHIENTDLGKKIAGVLDPSLGAMWIITFKKNISTF
jgi:ubiquinone/menaquinone biosynthesis C-methylase UbiE/uncharacterized protein YbaR (Trm112 family)